MHGEIVGVEEPAAARAQLSRLLETSRHREQRRKRAVDHRLELDVPWAGVPELLAAAERVGHGHRAVAEDVAKGADHLPPGRPALGVVGMDERLLERVAALRHATAAAERHAEAPP